jgi:hypothetical protein
LARSGDVVVIANEDDARASGRGISPFCKRLSRFAKSFLLSADAIPAWAEPWRRPTMEA